MNKSTLTFLGKDSGFGEKNTSAFYEDGKNFFLIDCGYTVFNILKKKFDFSRYEKIYVIITHLHGDHAGSLSQFILYLWFLYHKKIVLFSRCNHINEYLAMTGAPKEAYTDSDDFNKIEFIPTTHVAGMDCYGFKIVLGNKKIVYTGDTAELQPFLPYLDDADEFYTDASVNGNVHLSISEALPTLLKVQGNGTKVFLMHLDDEVAIRNIVKEELYFVEEI